MKTIVHLIGLGLFLMIGAVGCELDEHEHHEGHGGLTMALIEDMVMITGPIPTTIITAIRSQLLPVCHRFAIDPAVAAQ